MALVMWFGSIGAASVAAPLAPLSGSTAAEGTGVSIALVPGTWFTRTELFFGSLKPDGSVVSEDAFLGFLTAEITPRFPNGLTLLTGLGQFLTVQGGHASRAFSAIDSSLPCGGRAGQQREDRTNS
jgi:hypothetical protein